MKAGPSLSERCRHLEQAKTTLAKEVFNQIVGLPFSPTRLEELIKQLVRSAQAVREHPDASSQEASMAGLEEVLVERFNPRMGFSTLQRSQILVSELQMEGRPISLELWVKLLRSEQGKSVAVRKQVFDAFLAQGDRLTPRIEVQLQRFRTLAEELGTIVQDLYVRRYGIPWDTLRNLLENTLKGLSESTRMHLAILEEDILHRPPEYFDCPWTLALLSDRTYDNLVSGREIDLTHMILKKLGLEGFDVKWDRTDRQNKLSSPLAWPIEIPSDIRISCPPTLRGFTAFRNLLHEIGYAIFWKGIDANLPFFARLFHSPFAAQVLPHLLSTWLFCEGGFTHRFFGLNPKETLELRSQAFGTHGLWCVFDCIITLTKMDFWDDRLTIAETDDRFADYYQRYLGIEMPGAYWQLLPLVPEEILGRERTVVASVLLQSIISDLKRLHGANWLEKPDAMEDLCKRLRDGGQELMASPLNSRFLTDLFAIRVS